MRTIDADALKENISADTSLHTWTHEYGTAIPVEWIRNCIDHAPTVEDRPQGEYVDISKLRLMTVEECAGHTLDYAMGWKACIEWIKKGGAE